MPRTAGETRYVVEDLTAQDTWRIFRIMSEFVDGFEELSQLPPAVAIFGSARVRRGSRAYKLGEEIAALLVQKGYSVITGGGPGVMEAANKGAAEAKGISVGLNIRLPMEQEANPYSNKALDFRYFFVRKVMFVKHSQAFVILPGGFGTLDELFEAVTLIQTQKIKPFPVVLVDSRYWGGLLDWVRTTLVSEKMISPGDLDILRIADTPKDVLRLIQPPAHKTIRKKASGK